MITDLRPRLLARQLVALGLDADAATDCMGWLVLIPTAPARLALLRDTLRHLGQQHQAHALLDRAGLLDGDRCAHCEKTIRARACSVFLHGRRYCDETCCLNAIRVPA